MLPSAHPFCTPDVIAAPPITAATLAIARVVPVNLFLALVQRGPSWFNAVNDGGTRWYRDL